MSAPFQRAPVTLTPLSPIHIGSGEELDWTRAIPDGQELVVFDPLRVELPEKALAEMAKAADGRGSGAAAVLALQGLFRKHMVHFRAAAASRVAMTKDVADKFEKALGHNVQTQGTGREKVANMLALSRHAILAGDGRPYVPGSSLKGALRTAVVAAKDIKPPPDAPKRPRPADGKDTSGKDFWIDPSDRLIGAYHNSLFARVLLSDLLPRGEVTAVAAQVKNVRREHKEGLAGKELRVSVELIPPFLPGAFRGDIRIAGKRGRGDAGKIPELVELMQSTHNFHFQLFTLFEGILHEEERGLPQGWLAGVRRVLAEEPLRTAIAEGRAALVRLGKFCSAESKTVKWRSVRIPQAKPPSPNRVLHPYTLWLAELGAAGRLPLGWALLELADSSSPAVQDFCQRMRATAPTTGTSAGGGQPGFRPRVGTRVRVGDRTGKIIFEEDGVFTVELDDGEEIDVRPAEIRPA